MSRRIINLTGKKFHTLTVIGLNHVRPKNGAYWNCKCMCGNEVVVLGSSLTTGHTRGCGHNVGRPSTHGDSGTRFYKIWSNLKERCLNTNSDLYKYYGAKGIGISDEWLHSYEKFKLDMYRSYLDACESIGESDVTIDRKDSSLGYSKDNCQWLSRADNTSKARLERAGRGP